MRRVVPSQYADFLHRRSAPVRSTLPTGGRSGLSWRGFWTGAFLSFFLAIGAPYASMVMHASFMAFDFNTPGAIFLFLVLIGGLNVVFKLASRHTLIAALLAALSVGGFLLWYRPLVGLDPHSPGVVFNAFLVASALLNLALTVRGSSLALNRSELALVYVMLLIVSALCTMGLSYQLMPILTALFYYASPENKWEEKLFPHLPDHNIMVDDGDENRSFYEGIESTGGSIPYDAWIEPLLWWGLFLLALYTCMVCTAVILRRQWMERERLPYPLTQVGRAMIDGEQEDRLTNRLFRDRVMWMGAAVPLLVGSLRALSRYDVAFPYIGLNWALPFPMVRGFVNFALIGFSYFINTQVAAGIWVFYLLAKVERNLLLLTGMSSTQRITYGVSDLPFLAYQGVGALLAMVFVGLWVGREHLSAVVDKALGRESGIDDSDETMSYRSAVIGFVGGLLVMTVWLWLMGTRAWVALLFVVVALLIFVGITRIVCEAGLAAVRAPMTAPDLTMMGLGSQLVGSSGVLDLSLAYIWSADIRVFIMAMCANGLKLIEGLDLRSRRAVFWGIVLAIFIGAIGSCWTVFHLAYAQGGINVVDWFFRGSPAVVYDQAVRNLEKPTGVYWPGIGFLLGGGGAMGLLMWVRHRFYWWPLHPIGLPIGGNFMMERVWFNVFLAWLAKRMMLRFGGAATYHQSQNFFLGLIVGEALCNGLWLVIDYLTGKLGNVVFALG
ncbi:MAG TPA: DUF6785 family protein [Candidatus Latescibacteria bacterium]|jgi:hypothetical protein|nr:hypothetical protein [Candidatus Latescibacterota bacterium]HJP31238.1 DUF6785 family protein [Candidatus Latescibacterota bacterium]